jgi:fumarylacetoacetate (FAA) hydrolase
VKLASRSAGRDGELLVVSADLKMAVAATAIAPTLQAALDDWDAVAPALGQLYGHLNAGTAPGSFGLAGVALDAPLPRAWQWLDGSAFAQHGALMAKAFNRPPIDSDGPLMYQGMSHRFLGPLDPVHFPDEQDGIDFECEFAVITGDVRMGSGRQAAGAAIRLVALVNDWSLRRLTGVEVKTGFGFVRAKPACSAAPVVVTPEELGPAWRDFRVRAIMEVRRGDEIFGRVPADEMEFGFDELVAHAASTRDLCAGTLIGSGTVSSSRYAEVGSCCISERQAIEMIAHGRAATSYLRFGERVRMEAFAQDDSRSLFGAADNTVQAAPPAHR